MSTTAAPERHETIDPFCGITVDVATSRDRTTHAGRTYDVCAAVCLDRFTASPVTLATTVW